jgi:hypothetical protein
MRRYLPILAALAACDDGLAPATAVIELRIVAPAPGDTTWDLDPILLLGEASAPTIGVLPDDSIWWTLDGDSLGAGRRVAIRATSGEHRIGLHARHGQARDSLVQTLDVRSEGLGRVLWTLPLGYDFNLGNGLTLFPDGNLLAYEPPGFFAVVRPDGSVERRYTTGRSHRFAPPTLGPGGVAYYSVQGIGLAGVLAWAPGDSVRWTFNVYDHSTAPEELVFGGIALDSADNLYFATEALDMPVWSVDRDGAFRWRSATRPQFATRTFGWVAIVQDSLVVAMPSRSDSAVAASLADGAPRWTAPVGPGWFGGPGGCPVPTVAVGAAGTVYVPSSEGGVTAVAPGGQVLWSAAAAGMRFTNPIVGPDAVYGATLGGAVRIRTSGGSVVDTIGRFDATPATASLGRNDVLYVAGRDTLFSFARDGARRFATPVEHLGTGCSFSGYSGPVIADDGTVYLHATGGLLIAVRDTVGPSSDAPWPTFQGSFQRTGRVATGN